MRTLFFSAVVVMMLASCAPTVQYSPSEIQGFSPEVQDHIKQGKIALGMTPVQVRYSWGAPNAVNIKGADANGRFVEEWVYARLRFRGTKLVFMDGILTGIVTGVTRSDVKGPRHEKPAPQERATPEATPTGAQPPEKAEEIKE